MALDRHQVRGLAQAFVDTLSKLGPKEREQVPAARYAEELNRLVGLAKEVAPELDSRLWPQPIEVAEDMGIIHVGGRYADIETAARQVLMLLPQALMPGAV